MFRSIITLFVILAAMPALHSETYISETRYDWSGLAQSITSPEKTDYQKARDIYDWLTANISYDTTYSIRTADATYENRRGVCQGYCELFYRLAQAVGLRSEIIFGKSKDADGTIDDVGHAWMFVFTDGNSGILVDPTWGAGSVSDGVFERHATDEWFHAEPEWMIFTHFPDDPNFQLLQSAVTFDTFRRLPHFVPSLSKYGYKASEFLSSVLSGHTPEIPDFYPAVIETHSRGVKFPMEKELRVGTDYEFYILPEVAGTRYAIINGDRLCDEWITSGNQTAVRFMPHTAGELSVNVKTPGEENSWTTLAKYNVAAPTADDISRLEAKHPLLSPVFAGVKDFRRSAIEELGVDGAALLAAVKSEGITTLPSLYPQVGSRPVKVPWNGRLRAGNTYTFAVTPGSGLDFAVINNDEWTSQWTVDPATGLVVITATPSAPGSLKISARIDETNSFYPILEYTVE